MYMNATLGSVQWLQFARYALRKNKDWYIKFVVRTSNKAALVAMDQCFAFYLTGCLALPQDAPRDVVNKWKFDPAKELNIFLEDMNPPFDAVRPVYTRNLRGLSPHTTEEQVYELFRAQEYCYTEGLLQRVGPRPKL